MDSVTGFVSEQMEGKVSFYDIGVTENFLITEELGAEAVPTFLVFREGKEIARYEGPYGREALGDCISPLLAGNNPLV